MFLTMGEHSVKVVRWFPETQEVSYFKLNKNGNHIGGLITGPIAKIKYHIDKNATGVRVSKVIEIAGEIRFLWK